VKLVLEVSAGRPRRGEPFTVRLLATHDGHDLAWLDRRLLVGPNPVLAAKTAAFPVSVDPPLPDDRWSTVLLTPSCCYGRERVFRFDQPGQVAFHAYLIAERSDRLLSERPADGDPVASAPPLIVEIGE
jgi:hypothetical protein